ncbi:MAG: class I SAM-dependent methyltransferase [Bacteroidota bacterium]
MSESGTFYGTLIDPVLKKLRKRVIRHIEPGQTVLDIACGTGAQLFESAAVISMAVGFDYSESMINRAQKIKQQKNIDHLEFILHDATEEWPFYDYQFDVAVLSLALHQFSPKSYFVILNEMKRVATRQIFVDYAIPLPDNYAGLGSIVAEFFAGREHYKHFRQYGRLGGLHQILTRHRFTAVKEEFFGKNAFHLVVSS